MAGSMQEANRTRTEFYVQWLDRPDKRGGPWTTETNHLNAGGYASQELASTEGVAASMEYAGEPGHWPALRIVKREVIETVVEVIEAGARGAKTMASYKPGPGITAQISAAVKMGVSWAGEFTGIIVAGAYAEAVEQGIDPLHMDVREWVAEAMQEAYAELAD